MNYVQQCLPATAPLSAAEQEEARAADWNAMQAAASPSLLPNLKFHDLVFGVVLGEGAFSTVKYARHITRVRHCTTQQPPSAYFYTIYDERLRCCLLISRSFN